MAGIDEEGDGEFWNPFKQVFSFLDEFRTYITEDEKSGLPDVPLEQQTIDRNKIQWDEIYLNKLQSVLNDRALRDLKEEWTQCAQCVVEAAPGSGQALLLQGDPSNAVRILVANQKFCNVVSHHKRAMHDMQLGILAGAATSREALVRIAIAIKEQQAIPRYAPIEIILYRKSREAAAQGKRRPKAGGDSDEDEKRAFWAKVSVELLLDKFNKPAYSLLRMEPRHPSPPGMPALYEIPEPKVLKSFSNRNQFFYTNMAAITERRKAMARDEDTQGALVRRISRSSDEYQDKNDKGREEFFIQHKVGPSSQHPHATYQPSGVFRLTTEREVITSLPVISEEHKRLRFNEIGLKYNRDKKMIMGELD